jgi:uncharacterized protein (TIGR01370 family)
MRPARSERLAPIAHRRPGLRSGLVVALATIGLALGTLTGCGTPVERLAGVRSFALALGVDPLNRAAIEALAPYDLVVVDGGTTTPAQVRALRAQGALVLGYLSVGTLEPYRPWFAAARQGGWLLERWADWGEWYADVAAPGLRALLVAEAERELAKGFHGLFLDNTDMVEDHPAQRAGMVTVVAAIRREVGPSRLLFAQNGDASVGRLVPYLDGWNREDVSSTYDFELGRYRSTSTGERREAVDTLRRMRRKHLFVTSTDYTAAPTGTAVTNAIARSCSVGAVPFVSDIDLARLPGRPLTCR